MDDRKQRAWHEVETKHVAYVVEILSKAERNIGGRWLSAKQRDWLYGVWLRNGGQEVSASFPGIYGELADGARWSCSLFRHGTGGARLQVGPSAAEMEADRLARMADDEPFF